MSKSDEIIDLTDSIIYDDHRALIDVLIVLDSDESFSSPPACTKRSKNSKHKSHLKKSSTPVKSGYDRSKSKKWGDCPVCLDELGKNPLASTKCGHVFCLKCLEHSLHTQKRCPTCRLVLHGKSAYHPLYLNS